MYRTSFVEYGIDFAITSCLFMDYLDCSWWLSFGSRTECSVLEHQVTGYALHDFPLWNLHRGYLHGSFHGNPVFLNLKTLIELLTRELSDVLAADLKGFWEAMNMASKLLTTS